jgi:predicted PurR-regulated permease PerM
MDQQVKIKRILRKVWYGAAITLSVLVLLFSTVGVIGTWIFEQTLVDVTQNLLNATAKTAGGIRVVAARIDQQSGELRQISSTVSAVSIKIGQNIEDKGLARTLLPAEQEERLNATIDNVQKTLSNVREFLTAGMSMYRTINRLPFVDLPGLSDDTVTEIVQTVADTQATVEELRQSIQDFRSGVAQGIDRITQVADRMTQRLDDLSAKLAELDQALAHLQDLASQLEASVPLAFGLIAVLLTLLMVYVGYTQIEIIRLLVQRWKAVDTTVVLQSEPEDSQPTD